jgi:hypothetical protein
MRRRGRGRDDDDDESRKLQSRIRIQKIDEGKVRRAKLRNARQEGGVRKVPDWLGRCSKPASGCKTETPVSIVSVYAINTAQNVVLPEVCPNMLY